MGNIVLVHGAWGGGWAWDLVAPELRDRGHQVRTPELHRGTLAADTAAVQEAVDELGGPAVVAGWSYGGAVITGLDLPQGSHLVYVAALVPDESETALELTTRVPTPLSEAVQANDDGTFSLAPERADDVLWPDAPSDAAAAARSGLRPQAAEPLTVPPARVAWREIPSTYVLCLQDRAIDPQVQRDLSARTSEVVEWDCSHSPMLSRPADVIALLDKLAS